MVIHSVLIAHKFHTFCHSLPTGAIAPVFPNCFLSYPNHQCSKSALPYSMNATTRNSNNEGDFWCTVWNLKLCCLPGDSCKNASTGPQKKSTESGQREEGTRKSNSLKITFATTTRGVRPGGTVRCFVLPSTKSQPKILL